MVPGTYDIQARQGSTLALAFTLTDSEGHPVNLTGATPRMQVRQSPSSADVVLELTAKLSVSAALGGVISLLVPGSLLAPIEAKKYVYDLDVQIGDTIDTWLAGSFIVAAQVTR